MERKDYIATCRYYKGEDACPPHLTGEKAAFWFYEKRWVEMNMENNPILIDYIGDYAHVGLAMFSPFDGVPISLKALLFNRFCRTLCGALYENVEVFKEWFSSHYL